MIVGTGMIAVVVALTVVLSGTSFAQAQVLLLEEGFADSTLSDWTLEAFPGGLGAQTWSAAEGQPPGALELRSSNNAGVRTYSVCLPFGGDQPWSATAEVMSQAGGLCSIDFVYHYVSGCADSQIGSQQGSATNLDGVWVGLDRELLLDADPMANPVAVTFELLASGDGSCLFDNVIIHGTTPQPIPASNMRGLTILGAALAAIAFVLLRQPLEPS